MVAQTKTPMRRIPGYRAITVAILAACMACTTTPRSSATNKSAVSAPVVPLMSIHQYWDHHWFVWLPRHPTYEAVEIMSIDAPSNPYKAVWVFLTEREGSKRALHFFDDRRIVEGFEGSHFRDIAYRRTGKAGLGQSVQVALSGLDETTIEIAIDVDNRPLTRMGAGLTDQSGHSADEHLLLFYRDRNIFASTNTVLIDGQDFSFRAGDDPAGKHPFAAAYSSGIQLALIPFGHWSFSADGARFDEESSDLSFAVAARDQETSLVADLPGYRNRVTIVLDSNGALRRYAHDAASHRLVMTLDQALPLDRYAPRAVGAFSIHMDPDDPVAHGQVVSEPTAAGRRLSWRFVSPSWAVDYPFESIIDTGSGRVALTTRSLRAQ